MRDALISHEAVFAMAKGDAGRVYETMKVIGFIATRDYLLTLLTRSCSSPLLV